MSNAVDKMIERGAIALWNVGFKEKYENTDSESKVIAQDMLERAIIEMFPNLLRPLETLASLQEVVCNGCETSGRIWQHGEQVDCGTCNGTGKLPATSVVVPVEPTEAMISAGWLDDPLKCDVNPEGVIYCYTSMYQAMIKAAQGDNMKD